jgi:ribosome-associated protein
LAASHHPETLATPLRFKEMIIIHPSQCHAPNSEAILPFVLTSLDNDKAEDIVVIDLAGKTSIADYMVVASGASSRQIVSMADHLLEKLAASGLKAMAVEGVEHGEWVLLDAGDVIVHLFRPEVRAFYDLERLWGAPERRAVRADDARAAMVEPSFGGEA